MNVLKGRTTESIMALGDQTVFPGVDYEEHAYVFREDDVLYNTLTGEAVMADEDDHDELVRKWFLAPKGMNLAGLAHMVRQQAKQLNDPKSVNRYVIFTTTGCNAHCVYCYQEGSEVSVMTEEVAKDVAKYIRSKANIGRNIDIRWFGGEPLANKAVINLICQDLHDHDRQYTSTMSSNGDLFPTVTDDEIRLWNLNSVQFTVDARGEEYDRIKGLPEGAYDRLKSTVERIGNLGVHSTIRVHYDPAKGSDVCYQIIDDFKDYITVGMYAALLYDGVKTQADYEELLRIEDAMIACNKLKAKLPTIQTGISCMADNRGMACITPNGELTPCEHCLCGESYGSIYTKDIDQSILDNWACKKKDRDECENCKLYPSCEILCNCESMGKCDEGYMYYQEQKIRRALRRMG